MHLPSLFGCRYTFDRKGHGLQLNFGVGTVLQHSGQLPRWYLTAFWISTIIQLHNNSNGRKQMEGGRLPCTWCACNWEYNLQLWAQRITQCVASNSWNSRRASQLPSNIRRLKIEVYHLLVVERTRPTVLPNSHQAHLLKYMTNWGTFSSS